MTFLRAATAASVLAMATPATAQTTILFNNFLSPNDEVNIQVINPWIADIARVTEGRVTITQPESSLAPPPEILNAVQQGIADGGFMMVGFLENSNPLLQLPLLPNVNSSAGAGSVALWRTYEQFFAGHNDMGDVQMLGLIMVPPGGFYSMNDTVYDDVSDFNGVKFWALPGYAARSMAALGAVVTPGPAVRMYEVVSGGVVDAFCCLNYPSNEVFNVVQFTRSATDIPGGVFAPTFAFFVHNDVWNQISAEDQAAIRSVSGEVMARNAGGADPLNDQARERFAAGGGQVIEASAEFLAQLDGAWAPVYQHWIDSANAAGIDGAAALAFYRETMAAVEAGN
jgi:TRAP-type C4-dicarboxylate transport system substrate-binding protein